MNDALVPLNTELACHDAENILQEQKQFLTFIINDEAYAMDILHIKEIVEYGNITQIPHVPGFIRGVINLRGAVVPVIDLAARFGKQRTTATLRTCIVIIEVVDEEDTQDFGVMVDAVSEVLEISLNEIEPTPSYGTSIRPDFICGIGKINGKFVVILNTQQLLSPHEIASLVGGGAHNV